MNRLVRGDVGSRKTIVAFLAMFARWKMASGSPDGPQRSLPVAFVMKKRSDGTGCEPDAHRRHEPPKNKVLADLPPVK